MRKRKLVKPFRPVGKNYFIVVEFVERESGQIKTGGITLGPCEIPDTVDN